MRNLKVYHLAILVLYFLTVESSCASDKKKSKPQNNIDYDLNHPQKRWKLPADLLEISGNTWVDNNHLLAIEDLTPNLYLLNLSASQIVEKKIPIKPSNGKKFDVEDVAISGTTAYALLSKGVIYKIANWQTTPQTTKIETFLDKTSNTEGLCFDPSSKGLLVACKNKSGADDKKSARAIYPFNLQTQKLQTQPFMVLHKKDFEKAGDGKIEFNPSAIAVHPITNDVYVLATRGNKCLAIYSHSGQLKSVTELNTTLFIQPEGLCFSPQGVMYISTEGKKGGSAYLYQFAYK